MDYDFGPILSGLVDIGIKLLIAFVIFGIGRWLAGYLSRLVRRYLEKRDTDVAVTRMAGTLTYLTVLIVAFVVALGSLGIETTMFAALIAALGLAIGLALQGALANFAGGVLILTFHPFRVGDLVEISGSTGVVEDIQLVNTVMVAVDGSTVIIPNGQVSNSKIVNYSSKGVRRVDMVFGIGYEDDIQKAQRILIEIVSDNEYVLEDPAPTIRLLELADSSVNLAVQPFAKVEHYWDVRFDVTEQVKERFDAEGISFPYPQQDVHVLQAGNAP